MRYKNSEKECTLEKFIINSCWQRNVPRLSLSLSLSHTHTLTQSVPIVYHTLHVL